MRNTTIAATLPELPPVLDMGDETSDAIIAAYARSDAKQWVREDYDYVEHAYKMAGMYRDSWTDWDALASISARLFLRLLGRHSVRVVNEHFFSNVEDTYFEAFTATLKRSFVQARVQRSKSVVSLTA